MSAPAGAINAWKCDKCGRLTVARHADEGVTPMFLGCRASGNVEDCGGTAVSAGYPPPPIPDHIMERLEWEWFKPSPADVAAMSPEMQQHIRAGGLDLRRIGGLGEES